MRAMIVWTVIVRTVSVREVRVWEMRVRAVSVRTVVVLNMRVRPVRMGTVAVIILLVEIALTACVGAHAAAAIVELWVRLTVPAVQIAVGYSGVTSTEVK